jgi:hypothetical protein
MLCICIGVAVVAVQRLQSSVDRYLAVPAVTFSRKEHDCVISAHSYADVGSNDANLGAARCLLSRLVPHP